MKLRSETPHGVARRSALKERSHEAGPVARATFRRAAWQGAASWWIPQKSRSAPGFGGVFWISWESLQLIKASWRRVGELKRRLRALFHCSTGRWHIQVDWPKKRGRGGGRRRRYQSPFAEL